MLISNIKTMRGPNSWCPTISKVIVLQIEYQEDNWNGGEFIDQLKKQAHNLPADFLANESLHKEDLYQVVPALFASLIRWLQRQAGSHCNYINLKSGTKRNQHFIIYEYEYENLGRLCGQEAANIIENLATAKSVDIEAAVNRLQVAYNNEKTGPSTTAIITEALNRGIPVTRLNELSLVMLGYGSNQKRFCATVAATTSGIAMDMVQDKDATKRFLRSSGVPVPQGIVTDHVDGLMEGINEIGFPLAIKPLDANHGRGITTNVNCSISAIEAFQKASEISGDVIVEKHIKGDDFRLLVVNYKLVAAARRLPCHVEGNGTATVRELIDLANADPRRGDGHDNLLTRIEIDDTVHCLLEEQHLSLETIVPAGKKVILKYTANLSTGGTAEDVTDEVHKENKFLAEHIASLLQLDICGIDIISPAIDKPLKSVNGAVIEVNAAPGFRMHLNPTKGLSRNVAGPVIDMLFPRGAQSRIPLIAVTGTNGKTTTVRLLAQFTKKLGYRTGYTTTDGIYIRDHLVYRGDCSGPESARTVLRDPSIDCAVLECARGGIIRSGLGFDQCDIGILTNISNDHLGQDGINNIAELAEVKKVILQSIGPGGTAILNSEDEIVYQMKEELHVPVALFGLKANDRIKKHCERGGAACYFEDGVLILQEKNWKTKVATIDAIPLCQSGAATSMAKNVLAASIAASVMGLEPELIADVLSTFTPSAENTPGRMNLFQFPHCKLMIDYAHNEGGYTELKNYMDSVEAVKKIGIIAATGDRRDEDIRDIGRYAAQMFDEVILRHDKDGRGRSDEEMTKLVHEGLKSVKLHLPFTVISDEHKAIIHAVSQAEHGSFIVACVDEVMDTLNFIKELQSHYNNEPTMSLIHEGRKAS